MIDIILFFIGLLFVLCDISFFPAISFYNLHIDITLFYFLYLYDIEKENSLKLFALILIFKSVFVSKEFLLLFLIFYMVAFLFYLLIHSTFNQSNLIILGITAFIFFSMECLFIKKTDLPQFLLSNLFQFLIWLLILSPLFNKIRRINENRIKEKGVST